MKHTARKPKFLTDLTADLQYTFVGQIGNALYVRARQSDGTPVYVEKKYTPLHFLPTDDPTHADAWGFDGTPLVSHQSDTLRDAKDFLEEHPDAYGDIQPEYMYLADVYGTKDVPFAMERLYIWDVDIEVDRDPVRGFAPVEDPFNPIIAVTVIWSHLEQTGAVCYGTKDYTPRGSELYIKCADEQDLLRRVLSDLRSGGDYPDIITGYNVQGFDIPYFVNRCRRIFGEEVAATISPFERLRDRTGIFYGQEHLNIEVCGIAVLDYYELYRKFTQTQQESYKLDHIAHVELGQGKIDYKTHRSLDRLYREDHQTFIEYNLQDVRLVEQLDAKLKLLELVCSLAYMAKTNYVDTFKQVRLWDVMIYHTLRGQQKQIPPRKQERKTDQYTGAFVKDPQTGFHRWVISFDVASMYPHIIREWNLSPETIVDHVAVPTVDDLLTQQLDVRALLDERGEDVAVAGNGVLTRKDAEGFLPFMLKTLYDERVRFKKMARNAEKELQATTDPAERKRLTKVIAAANNQQSVRKINLNSAYGALGSNYFRFFDIRLAEAVTVTGQLIIRWVARDVNAFLNRLLKTENEDFIIASDTDSIYVRLETLVERGKVHDNPKVHDIVNKLDVFCEKHLQRVIAEALHNLAEYLNVYTPCLTMAREVIADKGIWTAKKRYILNVYNKEGVAYEKPKLKIMGIEAVKSSTPAVCRDMIKDALNLLMNGTQEDVWTFIETSRQKFYTSSFEDVAFPRGVNGLTKYAASEKGVPIHVRGALTFNAMLERTNLLNQYAPIHEGEKIKFVYLREPNRFFTYVMSAPGFCPPEWNIEKSIDYERQWDKSFIEPLDAILKCAGWSTKRTASLFD